MICFLNLGFFFEEKSNMQLVYAESSPKFPEITVKVVAQYFSFKFLAYTQKKIPHFAEKELWYQL